MEKLQSRGIFCSHCLPEGPACQACDTEMLAGLESAWTSEDGVTDLPPPRSVSAKIMTVAAERRRICGFTAAPRCVALVADLFDAQQIQDARASLRYLFAQKSHAFAPPPTSPIVFTRLVELELHVDSWGFLLAREALFPLLENLRVHLSVGFHHQTTPDALAEFLQRHADGLQHLKITEGCFAKWPPPPPLEEARHDAPVPWPRLPKLRTFVWEMDQRDVAFDTAAAIICAAQPTGDCDIRFCKCLTPFAWGLFTADKTMNSEAASLARYVVGGDDAYGISKLQWEAAVNTTSSSAFSVEDAMATLHKRIIPDLASAVLLGAAGRVTNDGICRYGPSSVVMTLLQQRQQSAETCGRGEKRHREGDDESQSEGAAAEAAGAAKRPRLV